MSTMQLIQMFLAVLLIVSVMIGVYLLNKHLKNLTQKQQQINQTLEDIARSQRILANNPKDFEETKRISQIKDKFS
ncbi:hypothetical protein [Marinicella pacifica]|nr:hypothetical protein [Marinicella pacifica]